MAVKLLSLFEEHIKKGHGTTGSEDIAQLFNNLEEAIRYHNIIYPLAKAIYGTMPASYATARLKTCLKLLGKIPSDKMRSAMEPLNKIEIENLKKAISLAGLKINSNNN